MKPSTPVILDLPQRIFMPPDPQEPEFARKISPHLAFGRLPDCHQAWPGTGIADVSSRKSMYELSHARRK
jgi:hypothetical protein